MKTFYFGLVAVLAAAACSSNNAGPGGGSAGSAGSAASGGSGNAANGGSSGQGATSDAGPGGQGGSAADAGGDGQVADTYQNFAKAFFQQYCVSCHAPNGSATPDLTQYANIVLYKATIRCGVATHQLSGCGISPAPEQFPIGSGPKPTSTERNRLVAWIDAGLPK